MNPVYFIGWSFYRTLFAVYFRWHVYNSDRVPRKGSVILAANHASFLDPPLVGSGLKRDINYLARKSLFRYPVLGWVLRTVNAVPVDRDGGGAAGLGLKAILNRLRDGGAIILFPESTRTKDGNLQSAHSGIGLTIIKSDAPVVPVRVWPAHAIYGTPLRSANVFQGAPEGNLSTNCRRTHGRNCEAPAA